MRPLYLEMTAFGPYRETTVLDFRDFKNQNLFLVCGPTGSGKTTIFDAIAYALYDSASGGSRNKDTFKSQFAGDDELCKVDFLFEYNGKEYRIVRSPAQTGPGKRGKTKKHLSTVEFHHDGQVTTKVTEANEAIIQLLSLNYDQFKQIVMLPQGEFKQLLESNSRDKEVIFRDIFRTENILAFQDHLKKQAADLKKEAENAEAALASTYHFLTDIPDEKLAAFISRQDSRSVLERLEQLEADYQGQEEQLDKKQQLLQTEINTAQTKIEEWKKYETLLQEQEELQQETEKYQQLAKAAADFAHARICLEAQKQVEDIQEELLVLSEKLQEEIKLQEETAELLENLQETFQLLEADYKKLPEQRKQRELLLQQIDKLLALEKILEEQKRLAASQKEAEKEAGHCQERLAALDDEKASLQETLQRTHSSQQELLQKNEAKSELQEALNQLKQKEKDLRGLQLLLEEQETIQQQLLEKEQKFREQSQLLTEQQILYRKNIAGTLAMQLVSEEPCPVCGSKEHPSPAPVMEEAPTEEELEMLEEKKNTVSEAYTKAAALAGDLSKRTEARAEELGVSVEQLAFEQETCQKETAEKESLQKEWLDEIAKLQETADSYETIQKEWEEKNQAAKDLELKQKEIQTNLKNITARLADLQQEEKDLQAAAPETDLPALEEALETISAQIKKAEKEYPEIKDRKEELDKQLAVCRSTVASYEEQLQQTNKRLQKAEENLEKKMAEAGLETGFEEQLLSETEAQDAQNQVEAYQDHVKVNESNLQSQKALVAAYGSKASLTSLTEACTAFTQEKAEQEKELKKVREALHSVQKSSAAIQKILADMEEILERSSRVKRLSDIANGSTAETGRMSFERYVLAIYYEEIVKAANHRLQQMTSGRYLLLRSEEGGKGIGAKGLELDVFDHYTGQTRSVKTLSGGESFKASLALALGLSDVMQSQSGGIQIDTLFIDEGFGTLDAESLDQAIQTLAELNSRGRMVGVISHVDELKTRIPAHIEVSRTADGSRAKIVL